MLGHIRSAKRVVTVDTPILHRMAPHTRESATILECVSASGCPIRPTIILKAKTHRNTWYPNNKNGPAGWYYATSPNGYTDDELGLLWLEKVFEEQTASLARGQRQIRITDGHGSHETADFLTFCFSHNIMLLRLPAHTSHLTQPLDVGCFGPLKKYYRDEVERLCQGGANKIQKRTFIDIYNYARTKALTMSNIDGGWRKTGLYPFDPEQVLSQVRTRPQTLPNASTANSTSTTDQNNILTLQTTRAVHQHVSRLLESSTSLNTPAVKRIKTLGHAAERAIAQNVLLTAENARLLAQNQERSRRKATRNHQLGRARLMTFDDIATARHVWNRDQQQSSTAVVEFVVPQAAEPIVDDGDVLYDDEDFSTFAVEYVEMYGDEFEWFT